MSLGPRVAVLILAPALLWGQLSPNTVTVTASSGSAAQPDQAVFSVTVFSGIDGSLDDIVKALAGSGITSSDLIGISAAFPAAPLPPPMIWTFQLIVPVANIQAETASLIALQKSIPKNNGGLSLSFTLQNAQTSGQQFQNCDLDGLMADARAQAQAIASAAGMSPTSIVRLQGATSQPASGCSLAATFALGFSPQSEPHTITITASRTLNPLPDQVLIAISVNSSTTVGLADVSSAIAAAGISGATFSGVSTITSYSQLAQGQSLLQWSFTLAVPLATLKSTLAQLAMAQQIASKQNSALSITFSIGALQVSPQAQPVCPQAGLISDATAQAQKLATAAGLCLPAPHLSMSTLASPVTGGLSALVPTAAYRAGDFSAISPIGTCSLCTVGLGYANFLLGPAVSSPATTCSLAVQFQLN